MLPLLSSRELPGPVQGECVAAAISVTVGLVWLFFSRVYRLGWAGLGLGFLWSTAEMMCILLFLRLAMLIGLYVSTLEFNLSLFLK